MKKLLLTLLFILGISSICFAGDGDFTINEVRPAGTDMVLSEAHFYREAKLIRVVYKIYDENGTYLKEDRNYVITNIEDDPLTEDIDETNNEFTQAIAYINSHSNLLESLKFVMNFKYGIE